MKKFFTIILSIALFGSAYSQDYIPFPEQNATWSLYNSSWEPTFDYSSVLETTGDTVINEVTYTKVMEYMPDWQNYPSQDTISRLFALYRQNIEEKKVYIIRLYLNESNEKLLYNFDENAEQPMNLPGLAYFEYSNDTIYNLEQITEVTLYDGNIRKEFRYKSVNNDWIMYSVLEGIGNKENPFGCSPIYLYPLDYGAVMPVLTCHTKNEEIIYVENDPMIERHYEKDWRHSIYQSALRVLNEAGEKNISPAQAAMQQADRLAREEHPVFGHRGYQIIKSLIQKKWHEDI